jgi:putative transposase
MLQQARALGWNGCSAAAWNPNAKFLLMLGLGMTVETHENWLEAMRYLNMDHLKEHRQELLRQAA